MHALRFATCLAVAACSSTEGAPADSDVAADSGTAMMQDELRWSFETVDDANAGFQPDIQRAADGRIGVAYFRRAAEIGACAQVPGMPPILRWDVVYAESDGGAFVPEVVESVNLLAPSGLSLAFDATGRPAVTFVGGTEAMRRCGGSDLVLARKSGGTWTTQVIAVNSSAPPVFDEDRMQCASAQNQCNVGDVVGQWSSLGFAANEPVVAFRDIHFGFTQDDELRSDLELYEGTVQSIDAGWGGGTYARLIVDGARRVVAHANPFASAHGDGVWVVSYDGTAWSREKITGETDVGYRLGLFATADRIGVAVHAKTDGKLLYFGKGTGTWQREVIDQRDDTGYSPWLVLDAAGEPAVSYRRCGPYDPRRAGCKLDGDALMFAQRKEGTWQIHEVAAERGGFDAVFTALAFDADGPVIAYQSTFVDPVTNETIRELRVARGRRQ